MATPYVHSDSFASLKSITETLQNNLTTSQYLQIYDSYLDRAIIPIITSTAFFDTFISSILGWQEKNFRRKVSFLHRNEVPSLIVNFLLQPSAADRVIAYKKLRLDRGIIIEFIKLFHDRLVPYIDACNCELVNPQTKVVDLGYCLKVKSSVEDSFRSRGCLLPIYLDSKVWLEKALNFKQVIMEKYVRLCLTNAQRDYVHYFNHTVSLDDIVQVYLMAASRAIDKCDSRQGALTSHIQNWFLTGRVRVKQQYESLTASKSLEVIDWDSNEAATACCSDMDSEVEGEEYQLLIRQLAKIADPIGAARALLGIEETLRESEIQILTTSLHKERMDDK